MSYKPRRVKLHELYREVEALGGASHTFEDEVYNRAVDDFLSILRASGFGEGLAPSLCSVDGCYDYSYCKSLCQSHYQRLKRHGDAEGGGTPVGAPERFIQEIVLGFDADDCLIWPFSRTSQGYSQIRRNGSPTAAHRYVCELSHGQAPSADHEVAHSCGNRPCVNPKHLRWATSKENNADKILHGTHNRGERCGSSKLTEAQAREILRLKGKASVRVIAARFGVSEPTVSNIHHRHTWAWLDTEYENRERFVLGAQLEAAE